MHEVDGIGVLQLKAPRAIGLNRGGVVFSVEANGDGLPSFHIGGGAADDGFDIDHRGLAATLCSVVFTHQGGGVVDRIASDAGDVDGRNAHIHGSGIGRASIALVACGVCHAGGVVDHLVVDQVACVGKGPSGGGDCGVAQIGRAVVHANGLACSQCGTQGARHVWVNIIHDPARGNHAGDATGVIVDGSDLRCRAGR